MHRAADKWQRTGAELFTETEKQIRRRIWYSCVIMDKYLSTYIGKQSACKVILNINLYLVGRPLAIFERDFDTHLPLEEHVR